MNKYYDINNQLILHSGLREFVQKIQHATFSGRVMLELIETHTFSDSSNIILHLTNFMLPWSQQKI
jgi:hypothetical protein